MTKIEFTKIQNVRVRASEARVRVNVKCSNAAKLTLFVPISCIKEYMCIPGTNDVNVGFSYVDKYGNHNTFKQVVDFDDWFESDFRVDSHLVLLEMLNCKDFKEDILCQQQRKEVVLGDLN